MSSLRTAASNIGLMSVIRPLIISTIDLISTANGKAIGASLFEVKHADKKETFIQTLHDEALEPFWATTVSWILAKASSLVTPWVPEQVAIIPGKLLGEAFHWWITSHQSMNATSSGATDQSTDESLPALIFNTFVKKPSDLLLRLCGLTDNKYDDQGTLLKRGESNFTWYGVTQIGAFALAGLMLRNDPDENLPGVNLDKNDPWYVNLLRGLGYTLVEQATFAISQTIRLYINFKKEFTGGDLSKWKEAGAKALANMIHERFIPGHILLGFSSALSTYAFGDYIPRTTAAALGEFPMAIFNRMANCHQRRATKYRTGQKMEGGKVTDSWYWLNPNGDRIKNYAHNDSSLFNGVLNFFDHIFDPVRNTLIRGISTMFKIDEAELRGSFDMNLQGRILTDSETETATSEHLLRFRTRRRLSGAGAPA